MKNISVCECFVVVSLRAASRCHPNTNNRAMLAEFTMIKGTVKTKREIKTQSMFFTKNLKSYSLLLFPVLTIAQTVLLTVHTLFYI